MAEDDRRAYAPRRLGDALDEVIDRVEPSAVVAAGERAATRCSRTWRRGGTCRSPPTAPPSASTATPLTARALGRQPARGGAHPRPLPLLSVARTRRPAAEEAPRARGRAFTPALAEADLVVQVAEHVDEVVSGISLAEAKVVVSGGRGVGSAEGFGILEELAGLLDAAVGCSRVVTSAGWRPHTDQVGQTGTKVSPDLYIACGISGATQHIAGCKGAKKILAINSDAEAPILASADYAVIGDLTEIVPAITAELRKARSA